MDRCTAFSASYGQKEYLMMFYFSSFGLLHSCYRIPSLNPFLIRWFQMRLHNFRSEKQKRALWWKKESWMNIFRGQNIFLRLKEHVGTHIKNISNMFLRLEELVGTHISKQGAERHFTVCLLIEHSFQSGAFPSPSINHDIMTGTHQRNSGKSLFHILIALFMIYCIPFHPLQFKTNPATQRKGV